MNAEQLQKLKGQEALVTMDGIDVTVRIIDARFVFGRIDVRIEPLSGEGQKWVRATSVKMKDAA